MHAFIHLLLYPIIIYKEYKVRISLKGIYTHLIGKKHKNVALAERRRIIAELG